jgi:hypothetical protein
MFEQGAVAKSLTWRRRRASFVSFKMLLMPCSWRCETKIYYLKPKKLEMYNAQSQKRREKRGGVKTIYGAMAIGIELARAMGPLLPFK